MIEFLLPSILAGLGIAVLSGPLGSFIVWRKMAYFGDTLAHASLMGLSLGILLDININVALVCCSLILSVALVLFQRQSVLATDTLLGILAHSSLSIGLIAVSFLDDVRIDLMGYLFGDLLSVTPQDLLFIWLGVLVVLSLLYFLWHPLLSSSVSEELASVEGINIELMKMLLMLMIGAVIAIGMKFVGALIMTSLLIIPAATARRIAKSPEHMAIYAALIGALSVFLGLALSWNFDTPAGPSVVVSASLFFILSQRIRIRD